MWVRTVCAGFFFCWLVFFFWGGGGRGTNSPSLPAVDQVSDEPRARTPTLLLTSQFAISCSYGLIVAGATALALLLSRLARNKRGLLTNSSVRVRIDGSCTLSHPPSVDAAGGGGEGGAVKR